MIETITTTRIQDISQSAVLYLSAHILAGTLDVGVSVTDAQSLFSVLLAFGSNASDLVFGPLTRMKGYPCSA